MNLVRIDKPPKKCPMCDCTEFDDGHITAGAVSGIAFFNSKSSRDDKEIHAYMCNGCGFVVIVAEQWGMPKS